jgi:gliding motility-associated-like protein
LLHATPPQLPHGSGGGWKQHYSRNLTFFVSLNPKPKYNLNKKGMKRYSLILITVCSWWLTKIEAQTLKITAETLDTCIVNNLSVDISVENFTDMTTAQFILAWDPAVLSYSHVSHSMPPPQSPLFIPNVPAGQIQFSWIDGQFPTPPGYSHPNGVLFTLHFTVAGDYGDSSLVKFMATGPFPIEFFNTSGQIFNYNLVDGEVDFDDTDPVISGCPASFVVTAPFGTVNFPVSWTAPTATDDCGVESFTGTHTPGQNFAVANPPVPVTYTAIDSAGNQDICTFTVDVIEGPNPNALTFSALNQAIPCNTATVNVPITVRNFDDMRTAQFGLTWDPAKLTYTGFTDRMNPPMFTYPTALYNDSDNANGRFRFGWSDADFLSDPGEDIPDDETIFILHFQVVSPASLPATLSFAAFPFQAGPPVYPPYPIEFSNVSGIIPNASVVLNNATVSFAPDVTAPTITCPNAVSATTNAGCTATGVILGTATATDNCTMSPTITNNAPSPFPLGATIVIWTAMDAANNMSTCTQTVTVSDDDPPSITCPAAVSVGTNSGCTASGVGLGSPAVSDNCTANPTVSNNAPMVFPLGVTTVTWTATDAASLTASCTQTVTVFDDDAPSITCPAAVNGGTNTGCTATSVALGSPTATDNCTANPTVSNNAPSAFPLGSTTVTWTATDAANNSATCTQLVTVADDDAPVPDAANLPNATGQCSVTVTPPTATDNCAGTITGTTTDPLTYNTQGVFTITWTYNDGNGNTSTQAQTVIVDDVVAPVPDVAVLPTATGQCAVTVTPPTATDNCAGTITGTTTDPLTYNMQGTFTVTWTYNDGNGNISMQTQTVMVDDTTDPAITCPSPVSVNTQPGLCTAPATWTAPTATDNCTMNPAVTCVPASGATFSEGVTVVTCTATDEAGNTATCTFNVTVTDAEDPVVTGCANRIVFAGANCVGVMPDYSDSISVSDNCSPLDSIVFSQFPAAGASVSALSTNASMTVLDEAGNSSTCNFTVTLVDNTDPAVICPNEIIQDTDPDHCDAVVTWASPARTDNCGIVSADSTHVSGASFPLDTTTVTYTVEDAAGNSASCSFKVIVRDTQAPNLSACPPDVTLDTDPGRCDAVHKWIAPTATDNCPGVTLDSSHASGFQFPVGMTTVSFTATDDAGNVTICNFTITVEDQEAPVFTHCPSDINKTAASDSCGAVVHWAAPIAIDNCGIASITCTPASGSVFPVGQTTVECIAADAADNKDTCTFAVTVLDTFPPKMTCPADTTILVPFGTVDTVIHSIALTTSDVCGVDTVYYHLTGATTGQGANDASGEAFAPGVTTVTYYAEDQNGNLDSCSFHVTIDVIVPLTLTCPTPPAGAVATDPGECDAVVNNLAGTLSPQPPHPSISLFGFEMTGATTATGSGTVDVSGMEFNVGTTTVTYYAVSSGNDTVSCSFDIAVADTEAPVLVCPQINNPVSVAPDICGVMFSGNLLPTATDNCPNLTLNYSPAAGSLLAPGFYNVVATATDGAGNNSNICTYLIQVQDLVPPAIQGCAPLINSPIVVSAAAGLCSAIVNWTAPTASDNCNLIAFTPSQMPGTSFNVGVTPVEYVAVDASGNISKCQFNVTVQDNQAPQLNCNNPSVIMVDNAPGLCAAVVNWNSPIASDNCAVIDVFSNLQPNSALSVGTYTVTYEAIDAAGNMAACSFQVIVQDKELPDLNVPQNIVVNAAAGECGANVSWQIATPTDNCGLASFSCDPLPGSFFSPGTTTVECEATDVNGNTIVKTFTVTVNDTEAPEIVCPDNVVVTADGQLLSDPSGYLLDYQSVNCSAASLAFGGINASDNCGVNSVTGVPMNGTFTEGIYGFTVVATDDNGNISTCDFTLTVEAVPALTAIAFPNDPCEGEDVSFFANGGAGATYLWKDPQGNAVANSFSFLLSNVNAGDIGTYTVEATLPSGCVLQGSVSLPVYPQPSISGAANNLTCFSGDATLMLTAVDNNNAGVVNWLWSLPNGTTIDVQNPTLFNVDQNDTGTYIVVGETAFGCVSTDDVVVDNITMQPAMPALSANDNSICVNGQVTLTAFLSGSNLTYNWSATPSQNSGLTATNNPVQIVNPSVAGDYIYSVFIEQNGCTSDVASIAVNVQAPVDLSDIAINGELTCVDGSSSITLEAPGPASASYVWEHLNTGMLYPGQNATVPNVTSSNSGVYEVTATTTNGCVSTATQNVAITDALETPTLFVNSAASAEICLGSLITLATTPNYGPGAVYTWTGPNLPANASLLSSFTILPTFLGTSTYTFMVEKDGCTATAQPVQVLVEKAPDLVVTVNDEITCLDGTTSVTLLSNAGNAVSWEWKKDGVVVSSQQNFVINGATSSNSGFYEVSAVSSIGCESVGEYDLQITDALQQVTASFEAGAVPCEGGNLRFTVDYTTADSYQWFNPQGSVFAQVQSPVLPNANSAMDGDYFVIVTDNGCSDTSGVLAVSVIVEPEANPETVVGLVNQAQSMNVVVNDLVTGDYLLSIVGEPNHGKVEVDLNNEGVLIYTPDPLFRETDRFVYEICYKECPDACSEAIVTMLIRYSGTDCIVTSVITPNNDGINDVFNVSCLEVEEKPLNSLIIFNEWGDKVYEAAPYKNDWQGTYQNKDLPDGTYFYIFQEDPDLPAKKGFVMIHR